MLLQLFRVTIRRNQRTPGIQRKDASLFRSLGAGQQNQETTYAESTESVDLVAPIWRRDFERWKNRPYLPAPLSTNWVKPFRTWVPKRFLANTVDDVEREITRASAFANAVPGGPFKRPYGPLSVTARIDFATLQYGPGWRALFYGLTAAMIMALYIFLPADGWKPFRVWLHSIHKQYAIPGLELLLDVVDSTARLMMSDPTFVRRDAMLRTKLAGYWITYTVQLSKFACCIFITTLCFFPRFYLATGIYKLFCRAIGRPLAHRASTRVWMTGVNSSTGPSA